MESLGTADRGSLVVLIGVFYTSLSTEFENHSLKVESDGSK